MSAATLDITAEIETPSGWLQLEDAEAGYELHRDSFDRRAVDATKVELTSEWAEGSYTARAVKGNVVDNVGVIITAPTPYVLAQRILAFTEGLEQLEFTFRMTFGDVRETWTCFWSTHSIETTQPLRFSTMAIITATIPHLPTIVLE